MTPVPMPERLALIPARGGSKRIPHKNIRDFCGKPILAYSVAAAFESGLFTEVMVSTDDERIAQLAREHGALVPFLRSPENANDYAGLMDVLREVLSGYAEQGRSFQQVCLLLPTAPLVTPARLREAHQMLEREDFDTVFPTVRFGYPIQRALQRGGDGRVHMIQPEHYASRSQDLPPASHDAGQFYWLRPERCLAAGRLFTDNSGAIEIPETEAQDIDTETDWALAELKYRLRHGG
ncbi:pseudaminic acid cytidylyltransferase [Chitiniphilus shinanonensis]|uniref:Pseudaminic acid cytidylyltransferase n=1 Tax=Chitiniphilus shinanonensis TaxID=553088 RepID=A0ABQ6BR88_9NEIS|nr:pseudaminic acid cytidylyltransferase [Chitiniphilus shinanonensis]GLS03841.1 pseudaminic acid cytidylyltransferase [Chitiniphilus shinanonensis]